MIYFFQLIILLCFSVIIYGLIIIHELSHYALSKYFKKTVDEVSFGIGPKFFGFKFKETNFNFRIFFFLGGYNKRQDEFSSNCNQRFAIAIIAPLVNILLGIFLISLAFGHYANDVILFKNGINLNHYFSQSLIILSNNYFEGNTTTESGLTWYILGFTGLLSYLFGLLNLIPIPPLDGSRALFHLCENFLSVHKRAIYYRKFMKYGIVFMILLNIFLLAY